jgi:hypothetical protein
MLQSFISDSAKGENMLVRLEDFSSNSRQKSMISRWNHLSSRGAYVEALEETLDRSDLLVAYPDHSSRQDSEKFIDLVRTLASDLGGDSKVIADSLRRLKDGDNNATEAINTPESDAVSVMTIHGSKGLESKVVILADLFSGRQTNIRIESSERLIVTPDLFAGHPKPWPTGDPVSPLWNHVKKIHLARTNAEARRLFYVAATRAERKLIVCGSPKQTRWENGTGLAFDWTYRNPVPQLGEMWLESLRQGSWSRFENDSHWMANEDVGTKVRPSLTNKGTRKLDPGKALFSGMLGSEYLRGLPIFHHPECFELTDGSSNSILTPLQRIERTFQATKETANTLGDSETPPRSDRGNRVRIAPHNLTLLNQCPRKYWMDTRGGDKGKSSEYHSDSKDIEYTTTEIDPALLGKVIHRIFEIGLMNPGPPEDSKPDLPISWTTRSPDLLLDHDLMNQVFDEILPPEANRAEYSEISRSVLSRIRKGPLGEMCEGSIVGGHVVEGLRTEMPFHLSRQIDLGGIIRGRWTPEGSEPLSSINSASLEMDGVIDLVLCTKSGDSHYIRPIDLKTEEAIGLQSDDSEGLISSLGEDGLNPSSDFEKSMLEHHSMQLTLYYLALKSIEDERKRRGLPHREVLRPAILIGVTGRIVEYPEEIFSECLHRIEETMGTATEMALLSEAPISKYKCECSNCT